MTSVIGKRYPNDEVGQIELSDLLQGTLSIDIELEGEYISFYLRCNGSTVSQDSILCSQLFKTATLGRLGVKE